MKADKIIKNARIFTSDKEHPMATALVVKDGKFVHHARHHRQPCACDHPGRV